MNKTEIFISYYLYSEYMFFYPVNSIQKQYTKITSLPDITYILHRVRDCGTYLSRFIELGEELTGNGKELRDRIESFAFGAVEAVALLEIREPPHSCLRGNPRHCRTLCVERIPELYRLHDESLQQNNNLHISVN